VTISPKELVFGGVRVWAKVDCGGVSVGVEGFGGLDADAVYGNVKIPVEVGLAASGAREPAFPSYGRLGYDCRLAVDRDFRCINLQAGDHWGELRVCFEDVGNLVRDSFRYGVRRQDQIDVNRGGCRCGNDSRLRVCEEGLGRGRKGAPSIRMSLFPVGSRTVTLVSVTGSGNTLMTRSSYSTWSMPSSPRTTWAS
jgi:hypothetical protein